jgi:hypothetical protein
VTVNGTAKPLLLIDVDGPLNPYARSNNQLRKTTSSKSDTPPEGQFRLHKLLGYKVWLNRWHGEQLRALADQFELTWCTTWEHEANRLIGPRIGLPDLPIIEFDKTCHLPTRVDGTYFKTHDVVKYVAGRPFAWVDDEISEHDEAYVLEHHNAPALLMHVNPQQGLEPSHFSLLASWASSQKEVTATEPTGGP